MDVNVFGRGSPRSRRAVHEKRRRDYQPAQPSDCYPPGYAPVAFRRALESLTIHLAVELAPRGIRVNAVSAGSSRGPMAYG
jgi:NAD(P)-dependent dehydrogenase (short-subunit alcohol dehydrogenase family)